MTSATGRRAPQLRGGIDLGGTKIEAIVVDARHKVLGSSRQPTPTTGAPADVAGAMIAAMRAAAAAAGIPTTSLLGVGVGSPGTVDALAGTVANAGNLPGWQAPYALGETLADELGTKVEIANDVSVATAAEFKLGAGRPYKSLLGVFWGTGVGGGLVLNGRPWHGRGAAGEIGHMVVVEGGRRCPCGRRGCMEAYAGRRAMEARALKEHKQGTKTKLFKIMKEKGRTRLTSSVWAKAVEQGDKLAVGLIDEAVAAIGAAAASAVNLLDVEAVIIGGGLGVRFGEPYARAIEQAMLPHVFNDTHPPAVHLAALGDLGGALGAALLVRAAARSAP